jgi:hypothetical protein
MRSCVGMKKELPKTKQGMARPHTALTLIFVRDVVVLDEKEILQQVRAKAQGKAAQQNFDRTAELQRREFEQLVPTRAVANGAMVVAVVVVVAAWLEVPVASSHKECPTLQHHAGLFCFPTLLRMYMWACTPIDSFVDVQHYQHHRHVAIVTGKMVATRNTQENDIVNPGFFRSSLIYEILRHTT